MSWVPANPSRKWQPAAKPTQARSSEVEVGQHRLVVFAGHGSFNTATDAAESMIDLPKGSSIYFWVMHGQALADSLARLVDSRKHIEDVIADLHRTLGSKDLPQIVKHGTKIHNYRLTPPVGLTLGNTPGTDPRFITRSLPQGMSPSAPVANRGITLKQLFIDHAEFCTNASIHWAACRSIVDR